jgi:hypothetical protein
MSVVSDPRQTRALLDAVRDWLSELNDQHRSRAALDVLRSWPANLLRAHGLGGLRIDAALQDDTMRRHRALVEHAARISTTLGDAGIRHAVLRGPISAAEYPKPAGRHFADLDLLVGRSQLTELPALLQRIGLRQGTVTANKFRPVDASDLDRERHEKRLHAFIGAKPLPNGRPLIVEIHHQFLPPYAVGTRDVTRVLCQLTTVTDTETGIELPALHPVDRAVELCTHLEGKTRHLPALRAGRDLRLGLYLDLTLLLGMSSISAAQVIAAAEGLGYAGEVTEALRIHAHVISSTAPTIVPPVDVRYFVRDGQYRVVADFTASFLDRLAAGSSLPFLRWHVEPREFDETYVQHSHKE